MVSQAWSRRGNVIHVDTHLHINARNMVSFCLHNHQTGDVSSEKLQTWPVRDVRVRARPIVRSRTENSINMSVQRLRVVSYVIQHGHFTLKSSSFPDPATPGRVDCKSVIIFPCDILLIYPVSRPSDGRQCEKLRTIIFNVLLSREHLHPYLYLHLHFPSLFPVN